MWLYIHAWGYQTSNKKTQEIPLNWLHHRYFKVKNILTFEQSLSIDSDLEHLFVQSQ